MQKRNLKKSVFPAVAGYCTLSCFHSATGESSSCGKHSAFCILYSTFSSAFSLIELIIVMMVVSILAAVVIIKFTGVDSQSNRIAANELRSHLTYIRNMAMNRERTTWVQFNIAANNYKAFMAVSNWSGTYQAAKDPVTQKDWIVEINDKFPGVALQDVTINGNNTNLYFSETNGTPFGVVGVARVPLTTNGVITFKSGLTVTVASVTGHADVK